MYAKDGFKLDLSQQAKRRCLGCNKKFLSQWIGNRLCKVCAEKNRFAVTKVVYAVGERR